MPAIDPGSFDVNEIVSDVLATSLAEQGVAEGDLLRDEHGRFVPRQDESDPTTDTPEELAAKAKGAKPVLGSDGKPAALDAVTDGATVTLPAADPAKLATKFSLKDATGELSIPDGLIVDYLANGKLRSDPLDKVVKMAQMGTYNHERELRVQAMEAEAEQVEVRAKDFESRLRTREQQITQLLADPSFRERAIAEYELSQTPDARAERLADRERELALEQERAPLRESGVRYYETEILPSIDILADKTPNVRADEIGARLHRYVDRLRDPRTGIVPPARYGEINRHFLSEIIPWAQMLDEHRAGQRGTTSGRQQQVDTSAKAAATKAELDAANIRAQKARRIATANLRPAGKGATPAPAKTKAPETRDEIMEDMIQSTLAMTRG